MAKLAAGRGAGEGREEVSHTVRCSICHDIMDAEEYPLLNVGTWFCCRYCWENMQDYLTARGFTILQLGPAQDSKG